MPPTDVMADEEAPGLLSPELVASLGVAGGDAMLTSAKKKQKPGGGGGAKHGPRRGNALPAVKKLSKSQKRKLAKVEEDKRKREQRAGVVARLNAAKLVSDESLTLLQGSDRMGQKMSKRETLRRELKAERAGIALPGTEHSRLLKRERPRDDDAETEALESSGSDASDASDAEDAAATKATFGRKQSWPNKALMPSTAPPPKTSYGPIHPLDRARLDAERIEKAAFEALAGSAEDDLPADSLAASDSAASESARAASRAALAAARALSEHVRALDPEQEAERRVAALGPNAAAAAYDPKDTAAKMAAANEAAAAAAAARYPGVFVGASHCVPVTRDPEVVSAREGLPILGAEHEIVDAVNSNPLVVLCGETGCGKTTQVPQFLFEAGYGDPACAAHPGAVAVTQPRRVAVTSTATRVARELNVTLGREVGYQVRYDKKVMRDDETRLKFMTDGILLREMRTDLLLRKYSVVIVDEAHERGVNTDILLGLLSRVVPLRAELFREGRAGITPLRLVVMSATLRVEEFVENKRLCPTPPALLRVRARQFPVTNHFARETVHADYVSAARKKVLAIHRKLPPGGILVFVTGQREVEQLCAKLRRAHPAPAGESPDGEETNASSKASKALEGARKDVRDGDDHDALPDDEAPSGLDAYGADVADDAGEQDIPWGEDVDADAAALAADTDDFDDDFDDSGSDVSEEDDVVVRGGEGVTPEAAAEAEAAWARAHAPTSVAAARSDQDGTGTSGPGYLHVLPLYAMLPPHLQKRVFDPPPPGARAVVVATNVAETSLTIPGVRYVVDCGREKRRVFGASSERGGGAEDAAAQSAGVSRFEVAWVSQASAEQRAGRAGRTGPGHCYRLFSSAHFVNALAPHAAPAISQVPVDGVVLQMRAMGIDKIARFPFLTPPEPGALRRAQRTLAILGALRPSGGAPAGSENAAENAGRGHFGAFGDDGDVGVLTPLGEAMAALPIGPRHARMLLAAAHSGVEGCLAAAVAAAAALSLDSPFLRDDERRASAADAESGGDETSARNGKDATGDVSVSGNSRGKLRFRFHHPHSDALSAARALVAYDALDPNNPRLAERFCRDHCLHGRTMREASDLRRQLLRALASPSAASALGEGARAAVARAAAYLRARRLTKQPSGDDPALAALRVAGEGSKRESGNELTKRTKPKRDGSVANDGDVALRRALLRGWADRVARRVKPSEALDPQRHTKTRATRYKPALLGDTVYLHPSSSLHKTSPEYVAYADVVAGDARAYLGGATAVDAAWLADDAAALASLSAPLEDPAPRYVPDKGIVVAFTQPHFGKHRWALPLRAEPISYDAGGCGAFAAALLSGAVSRPMLDLRARLAAKPSLCARAEGKTQRRVSELVHALQRRRVASKRELQAQWRRDPAFLMREARGWMKRGHEHFLERAWPRVVAAALGAETDVADVADVAHLARGGAREGGGDAQKKVARTHRGETGVGAPSRDARLREGGRARDGAAATTDALAADAVSRAAAAATASSSTAAATAREARKAPEVKRRRANPAVLDGGLSIWDE